MPFTQGGKQQEARSKGEGVKSEGGREIRGKGARVGERDRGEG